ncbi:hypothetical protein [Limnohabitans sp.]|uniref:hypothetical protein n=1 Tax=Limnohabitans sp. TaxID=1907725 RepID=UPI0025BDADDD|nr:hypothetical protein [Limnohabitans sp.]
MTNKKNTIPGLEGLDLNTIEAMLQQVELEKMVDEYRLHEKAMREQAEREQLKAIFKELNRFECAQFAIDMVGLFSDPEAHPNKCQDWLDSNRDSLTVENLRAIIWAGVSEHMAGKQTSRSDITKNRDAKIKEMWEELKAKKISKAEAAEIIAPQVHLAVKTVRKKLQGMD